MVAVALVIALALEPSGAASRLQVDVDGNANYTSIAPAVSVTDAYQAQGGGDGALTVFAGRRLVDDDAPLSLQPFLQRLARVRLSGGGAGFQTVYDLPDGAGSVIRRGAFGHVEVLVDGYAWRKRLYLALQYGVSPTTFQDVSPLFGVSQPSTTVDMPMTATVGWRFGGPRLGELLVDAGWSVSPEETDGSKWSVPFWGGAFAGAQWVFARRWMVTSTVTVVDGGARVAAGAQRTLGRRLDLSIGVSGGAGRYSSSGESFETAGGRVGVFFWWSRFFGGGLSYAPSWTHVDPLAAQMGSNERTQVAHVFLLTLSSRPK